MYKFQTHLGIDISSSELNIALESMPQEFCWWKVNIGWTIVGQDLWRNMMSLGHNELNNLTDSPEHTGIMQLCHIVLFTSNLNLIYTL